MTARTCLISAAILGMMAMPRLAPARAQQPTVSYVLRVDSAQLDTVDVSIHIEHAPPTLRLAMKVHPEYDARYWRYVDGWRIDGTADDARANVTRLDSTLWRVALPGGHGVIHYRVHVQRSTEPLRRSWQPFIRNTGALINSPDFFLYLPDFAGAPVSARLDLPRGWRIATALSARTAPATYGASDAAAFLDSPILVGTLREWTFTDHGTRYHVVYWPLPDAAPFDTTSLLDGIRRLASSASAIFGSAPVRDYYFLLQDGASDALEHRASLTMGLPSSRLARDPHASLPELAHEFFHTWNLVAVHPDSYGALSYQSAVPTSGLWMGEGVTLYYADLLLRRAGLVDTASSRLAHLAELLSRYYAAPWRTRVSPERASLAFGASAVTNGDATGGYYLQGELLAHVLDALVRDSTRDRRGLDDVMRALYIARAGGGFTSRGLERVADSVCRCALHQLFENQIRGSALIDATPVLARVGLRIVVDTVPATDASGAPLPDRRLGVDFSQSGGPLRLVVNNPASVWSSSGLQTGDVLVALNGAPATSFAEYRRALLAPRIGDTIRVDVQRDGRPLRVTVIAAGYLTPRVRFVDLDPVTPEQRARRARWLGGW